MDLERFTENILISVNGVHSNENNSLNSFPENNLRIHYSFLLLLGSIFVKY